MLKKKTKITNSDKCHVINNKQIQLTFSCLKKHSILSSRNTRFDDTSDWNTFGSFLSATRRPSRGSVTALSRGKARKNKEKQS